MKGNYSESNIKQEMNDQVKKEEQLAQKTLSEDHQKNKQRQIWFCQLFRFATKLDYILMIVGSIAAIAQGVAMPAFALILGRMINSFSDPSQMVDKSRDAFLIFIWVGIGSFFVGWLMFACWMITGQRQAIACRKAYLKSLLSQQIGWFDVINQTQLASSFAADTFAFQGAIGQKISTLIMTFSTLLSGFIIAFVTGWLMTLVVLTSIPAFGIAGYFYIKVIAQKDKQQQKAYAKAGGKAEQAISAIKTVKQLNGEQYEIAGYQNYLSEATTNGIKYAIYAGLGIAGLFFVDIASYALGFWYGSRCVINADNCHQSVSRQIYTAGDVVVIFFSIVMGGFTLTQLTPSFKKISQGRQAGARIFSVIDREPTIKNPPNGIKIENLQGKIRFENVTFFYPKDPSRKVFDNLTLEFNINKTGLVGESGCGKSTTLQLIMRFYDPDQGRVTLDGHDLKTLDLVWLRKQIGYVGQEPVLFATSIKQNLIFGNQEATDQDIKQALKMAEAYDFVQSLEEKQKTYVGYGGGQLSGGQKQRLAIARAILRKPKIMLLDEATSALDRRNQKLIQDTLQKITEGMTTITVAHRVKTIMNSDMIYVFDKGGIKESGRFKDISMFKNFIEEKENEDKAQAQAQEFKVNVDEIDKKSQSKSGKNEEIFLTKEQKEKNYQKTVTDKYDKQIFSRIFSYSKDKLPLFILGIICALGSGVIYPIFSIFLGRMFSALLKAALEPTNQDIIDDINFYSLIFFILACIILVTITIQTACFNLVGDHITKCLRVQTLYKMLKMPIPWFDIPRNNAGTLTARLSTDCQAVNTLTTTTISILVQNLSTLVSAIVIAFVFEWRTALVALGMLPLMILAGIMQMAFTSGFGDKTDVAYKDSSNLIMESMMNIRTVKSSGYQKTIIGRYNEKLEGPKTLAIKKGNTAGIFYGLSQFILFLTFGLLFFLGSIFMRDNQEVSTEDMFIAAFAIMFGGMVLGNNAHYMPDTGACRNSAANLFEIMDSQDEHQMQIKENSKLLKDGADGDIVLEDVDFKYQSRNQYVFKNMSIRVKNGQKVAFVGTSGCGKSTIMQLVQRFYFPSRGKISINNIDIKDFDLHYLRSRFGVVSQEPVLFNGSFTDNIKYNKQNATMADVENSARLANALSFIIGNEQTGGKGFDRNVGVKGSHISGGQKQRVAIARTIIRDPHILLLDEATSALDRKNQIQVQQSLDSIMKGRTVVSIAHRIDTIKNSDQIFMFQKGKIIESGSYHELIQKKGHFYNLERGTSFT